MIIGAQLFTVRKFTETKESFAETLSRVRDIGYSEVQISATCPYEPEWLREQLLKNELKCSITNYDFGRIMNDTENVIKEHRIFGCDHIGIGSIADQAEFDAKAHEAARMIADAGMLLMHHNHDKEYMEEKNGRIMMRYLAEEFSPRELGFTLDVYWAEAAGYDAVSELERLSGRVPCIHFKDMLVMPDGEKRFAPVGSGVLDFEKIAEAAERAGTRIAYVEQDGCYGEDPFLCLKKSYRYLRSIGLS